ncbi:L-threonylcarbamoyladenylate synthase [Sediminibacterium sp.]|uniref:L-threonylcarbamoyladenylate synthase n=1 Tax=Sediminibacterium sp. TaxID=1917865 RepID=UPI002736B26A|nr:L-threonylcarbamoyladenylate synthase [Sediminibacterium sp.]MDP3393886.1 L-threonylcarbamoyladenylate synthase [Sediminibacterium sp.]MDP3568783.1 L-threonylcarbamoyladenylate synthase [Sediminibacterium sp.]
MQTAIGTDINIAAAFLKAGELVAIPTETVYGLAANALSESSVAKIYAAKNRPSFNPLIIHIANITQMHEYAFVDEISLKLAQHFMPGPLTLLLPKKSTVPDITTAGSKKVAIRIPNQALSLALLSQLDFPLAAPSANRSGYISPTNAHHVMEGLHGKIPYILDGGDTAVGLESTICEVAEESIILHRAGSITAEDLAAVTGMKVVDAATYHAPVISDHSTDSPATPGQLKSHYAPHTPLYMGHIPELIQAHAGKKMAVISFHTRYEGVDNFILAPDHQLSTAASKLFATLRAIDNSHYEIILSEQFPNEGIGIAINDRISRAQFILKH